MTLNRFFNPARLTTFLAIGFIVLNFSLNLNIELGLDEYATWWVAKDSLHQALFQTAPFPPHPVTYGLVHYSMRIFGETPMGMRFPNLLLTITSLIFIVQLHKRLLPTKHASFLSVLFLVVTFCLGSSTAVSLFLARSYAASFCFLIISFYFLSYTGLVSGLLVSLFSFLAVLNQPALLIYSLAIIIISPFVFNQSGKIILRNDLIYMLLLISSAPIFGAILSHKIGVDSLIKSSTKTYQFMPEVEISSIATALIGSNIYLAGCGLVLIIMGMLRRCELISSSRFYPLLAICLLHSLGLYTFSHITSSNFMMTRYSLYSEIIWMLAVGALVDSIVRLKNTYLTAATTTLLIAFILSNPDNTLKNSGWRELTSCLESGNKNERPLVVLASEHLSSLHSSSNPESSEVKAWLAPFLYYNSDRWADLTLLTTNSNWHLKDELKNLIDNSISKLQPIYLVYAPWTGEVIIQQIEPILLNQGYKGSSICESGIYRGVIYRK